MPTHRTTIDLANQGRRKVRACFDGGRMSSDGGTLLLQAVDQRIGLTKRLAACFLDRCDPHRCKHPLKCLLAQRLFGLALGHQDVNGHDRLRDASLLALATGSDDLSGERRERERDRGHPLAGSSTLNRLGLGTPEQVRQDRDKRIAAETERLDALLVELFLDSHAEAPQEIVLDVDATDDPLSGRQEGRFFHGYYDCYRYLPLYVACRPHMWCGRLRRSTLDTVDGAVQDLERIRQRWPQVRGDFGFCGEELMALC